MKAVLALLLLAVTTTLYAQEKQWDIRFAAAGGTQPFLHDGGRITVFNIFPPEWKETAFTESVMRRLGKRIWIGLSAAQTTNTQYHVREILLFGGSDSTYPIFKKHFFVLMPSIRYSFLEKTRVCLYSEVSAGIAFTKARWIDKEQVSCSMQGACQVTFFGVRFGGRIAGFVDLGYGYQGILQAGISGQL